MQNPPHAQPAAETLKRFAQAAARKQGWAQTYEDALRYAAPQRNTFEIARKGDARDGSGEVYDSTALIAMQKFAANLQSSLVPPFRSWVRLVAGPQIPDDVKPVLNTALEEIRQVMFTHLHMSNFDTQIAESFLDLAVGTGALLVQPGRGAQALQFVAVPLSQLSLEEGANGQLDGVFRRYRLPVRAIEGTWEDAVLTPKMHKLLADQPDAEVTLIEATIPHTIMQYNPAIDAEEPTEGYLYSVVAADEQATLLQRPMRSSPWVIFRYGTLPGEIYGRGPLLSALPDIKTLNKTKELILKNASLAVAGAYTVADDGVININTVKIRPGALIPVSSNGGAGGPTLAPLPRSGDFNIAELVVQDLQASINDALMANVFGAVDAPARSATEMAIRQQELARRMGSAFGRLQYELIAPLLRRILHVLEEQGLVDLSRFTLDGKGIAIVHQSPVATAHDNEELANILRYADFLAETLGREHPLVVAQAQNLAERVGELMNIPPQLVVGKHSAAALLDTIKTAGATLEDSPALQAVADAFMPAKT